MTFRTEFKNSLKKLGASESDADSIIHRFFVELANADDFTRKASSSAVASFVYNIVKDQRNSTSIAAAFINRARDSAAAAFINIAGRSGQHSWINLAANFVANLNIDVASEFVRAVKFVSSSEISKLNLPHPNYYEGQGYFHNDIFYVRRPELPDGPPSNVFEVASVEWAGGTVAGIFVATLDQYTLDEDGSPSCTFVNAAGATEAASFVTRTMQTYGTDKITDPQLAAEFVNAAGATVAGKFVNAASATAAAAFVNAVGGVTAAVEFLEAAGGEKAAAFVSEVGGEKAGEFVNTATDAGAFVNAASDFTDLAAAGEFVSKVGVTDAGAFVNAAGGEKAGAFVNTASDFTKTIIATAAEFVNAAGATVAGKFVRAAGASAGNS